MNTDKIKALLLTVNLGSISAAAEEMNYTPSAISRSIQSLEKDLGVPLLMRYKSGAELSEAGKALLPDLRRVLQEEELLFEHATQLAEGYVGTIRLGICYPAFFPWISSAMVNFKKIHPKIQFDVSNGYSTYLMEQVEEHELDLCLISKRSDAEEWLHLVDDELVAILPSDHPLAKAKAVPISTYEDGTYLELNSDLDTDNARAFAAAGIRPKTVVRLSDSSPLYPMVEAGLGIGMENRINVQAQSGSFVIKPITPAQPVELGIAYSKDVLPVTKKFIDYLSESRQYLSKHI